MLSEKIKSRIVRYGLISCLFNFGIFQYQMCSLIDPRWQKQEHPLVYESQMIKKRLNTLSKDLCEVKNLKEIEIKKADLEKLIDSEQFKIEQRKYYDKSLRLFTLWALSFLGASFIGVKFGGYLHLNYLKKNQLKP